MDNVCRSPGWINKIGGRVNPRETRRLDCDKYNNKKWCEIIIGGRLCWRNKASDREYLEV